jgi:signal peptidase I
LVKERVMRKAAKRFGFALMILLLAIAGFTFLVPRFGWRVDAVFTGSMEPALKVGGVVITHPVEADEISVGDIITFYSPQTEKLTSHRVTAIQGGSSLYLQTKGDANENVDAVAVPVENVVGKVGFHIPYLGYATQFVKTRLGLILTLFLPGLFVILLEIRSIWRMLHGDPSARKQVMR